MVVLDTCALYWWVANPGKLSRKAARAIKGMERLGGVASSICFWELGVKERKGKIALGVPFDEFCRRVEDTGVLEIPPVDLATWRAALQLDWKNRDPVDRVVVATAKARGLSIITADKGIRAYYRKTIW